MDVLRSRGGCGPLIFIVGHDGPFVAGIRLVIGRNIGAEHAGGVLHGRWRTGRCCCTGCGIRLFSLDPPLALFFRGDSARLLLSGSALPLCRLLRCSARCLCLCCCCEASGLCLCSLCFPPARLLLLALDGRLSLLILLCGLRGALGDKVTEAQAAVPLGAVKLGLGDLGPRGARGDGLGDLGRGDGPASAERSRRGACDTSAERRRRGACDGDTSAERR